MEGWREGWRDGWMDGWMDEWRDGGRNGCNDKHGVQYDNVIIIMLWSQHYDIIIIKMS